MIALLPNLRAYALALTKSDHKAEDLLQDTLERAWKSRDRFNLASNLEAWLCSIMRNRFIDGVRQDKWTVADEEGKNAALLQVKPGQHWQLYLSDLLRAIDGLSASTREAVFLCWFGGLSHEEAAIVLGCPLGTLKGRIKRAREALAQTLDMNSFPASDF